jgi:hypothetical protein
MPKTNARGAGNAILNIVEKLCWYGRTGTAVDLRVVSRSQGRIYSKGCSCQVRGSYASEHHSVGKSDARDAGSIRLERS